MNGPRSDVAQRFEFDPNRLRGPRCLLTASARYDMLMLLVEENGFRGMAPQLREQDQHCHANQ